MNRFLVVLLLFQLALTGCGGGGGGDNDSATEREIAVSGSVMTNSSMEADIQIESLETGEILAETFTDDQGHWQTILYTTDLNPDDNLLLVANNPVTGNTLHSLLSCNDLLSAGSTYSSELTTISHYSEAALSFALVDTGTDRSVFMRSLLEIDEDGRPVETNNIEVNRFASYVLQSFSSSEWLDRDEYLADLLREFIWIRWPAIFSSSSSTTVKYPAEGQYADYSVEVSASSELPIATSNNSGITITSTGVEAGTVIVEILHLGALQTSVELPIAVYTINNLATQNIEAGSEQPINVGSISIRPAADSFSRPTSVSVSELTQLPAEFPDGVLKAYDIKIESEPDSPIAVIYSLAEGEIAEEIILVHIDPLTKDPQYIYPVEYNEEEGWVEFSLDSMSPLHVTEKEDGGYTHGYYLTAEDLLENTKESFQFIKKEVIDYLDNNKKITNLSRVCTGSTVSDRKKCEEYFHVLGSKALYSFLDIMSDQETIESLDDKNFKYNWVSFSVNAQEEYFKLRGRLNNIFNRINNTIPMASVRLSWDQEYIDTDDLEMSLVNKVEQNSLDYYFQMMTYHLSRLGMPTLSDKLEKLERDIEYSTRLTPSEKCSAYTALSKYLEKSEKNHLLLTSPKLPAGNSLDYLIENHEKAFQSASEEADDIWSSYVTSELRSKALVSTVSPFVSEYLVGAYVSWETYSTFKSATDEYRKLLLNIIDRNKVADQMSYASQNNSAMFGSPTRWIQYDFSDASMYFPPEVIEELNDLDSAINRLADKGENCYSRYTVTASSGSGGSVTPGSRTVIGGLTTNFTVSPDSGYAPNTAVGGTCSNGSWNGNTYRTGAITSNCSVSFSFSETVVQRTVTASAGTGGRVTPSSRSVDNGTTTSFSVTPDSGYTRNTTVGGTCSNGSWSGNTYTTGAITRNCSVSFSFSETVVQRTVTASAGTGGRVTPSSQSVNNGSTTSFTVTPNTGYQRGNAGGTCPSGSWSDNTYTTGAITNNCSVSFSFSSIQRTVTASAGTGGSVTPGSRTVNNGSTTSFTVTPNSGYLRGNAGGTCPSGNWNGNTYTTGAITGNCSVSFSFSPITVTSYPLNVSKLGTGIGAVVSSPSGISCGSSCSASFTSGTSVSLTASPSSGSSFAGWSGACSGSGSTCTVSMSQTRNVIATFNLQSGGTAEYVDNGNGTVTDLSTGLIWQQLSTGGGVWPYAITHCEELVLGGSNNWRLPNFEELRSIVDTVYSPAINPMFEGNNNYLFWSATTTSSPDSAWSIFFGDGTESSAWKESTMAYARCVQDAGGGTVDQHAVTASAESGGNVAPSSRTVINGSTTSFSVTPNSGYNLNTTVGGTCPRGDWSGSTYTTGAITSNCSVNFSFTIAITQNTIPDTGQTLCYDSSGSVIACADTGQDGEYSINTMSFAGGEDGTVTDNITGLIWQKEDDNISRTWVEANSYCSGLNLGNISTWRLPSDSELHGIVNFGRQEPSIDPRFVDTETGRYWTSSSYAYDSTSAWYVDFYGGSNSTSAKTNNHYVRCVR